MRNMINFLKSAKFKTGAFLIGLFLIGFTIFSYNTHNPHLNPQASIRPSDTSGLHLTEQALYFHTLVPYFKDSANAKVLFHECEDVAVKVYVNGDSVSISNMANGKILLDGVALELINNKSTIIGLVKDKDSKLPTFFTLARYIPEYVDESDPSNLSLILHMGTIDEPFFILSQKATCAELQQYLKIN